MANREKYAYTSDDLDEDLARLVSDPDNTSEHFRAFFEHTVAEAAAENLSFLRAVATSTLRDKSISEKDFRDQYENLYDRFLKGGDDLFKEISNLLKKDSLKRYQEKLKNLEKKDNKKAVFEESEKRFLPALQTKLAEKSNESYSISSDLRSSSSKTELDNKQKTLKRRK